MSSNAARSTVLTALCVSLLVACAGVEPVLNVDNERIPRGWSIDKIQQAIIEAGRTRGWIMKPVEPGHIVGVINVREHQASIDLYFDTQRYSIMYRGSDNLDYRNGRIHRNYNGWIMNLNRDIQTRLSL